MAGSMHWTSKFRTLKWLQRRLMSAKTLQKTLPGFGKQSQVIQAQARPLRMSSSRFYRVHCHLSVVVGLRTACSAQETGVHLSEQATTGGRPGAAMYSVAGVYTVQCTLYLGAAMFRVWQRAQSGGRGLKSSNLQSLSSWISPLTSPPIEPVGWDAGKMGSKMRRRGLYSRSHVPLSHSPLAELQGLHWPPLLRF